MGHRQAHEDGWCLGFGNNLKNMIESKAVVQKDLAKRLGLTEAMLSRYIHGLSIPSAYKVCQLANELNCDVNELLKIEYEK